MFLIDTSVWIDYFRESPTHACTAFEEILDRGLPFGLTAEIYQEILQGADSAASFDRLQEYLNGQEFYETEDRLVGAESAARLYFKCRRAGITIRSTIDCSIAQIAIEQDLILVHNDRDFERLAEVVEGLTLFTDHPMFARLRADSVHESKALPYDAG